MGDSRIDQARRERNEVKRRLDSLIKGLEDEVGKLRAKKTNAQILYGEEHAERMVDGIPTAERFADRLSKLIEEHRHAN